VSDRPYLSIGEVLGLLLEEFPDVTISKIRFLESQGLIDPERTPSGYRKFYDGDVERLRVILREQRENFLPLRVIRDRLESGEIDEAGTGTPPKGIRNVAVLEIDVDDSGEVALPEGTMVPTHRHPAGQLRTVPPSPVSSVAAFFAPTAPSSPDGSNTFLAGEVCSLAGITDEQLAELESYGILSSSGQGSTALYSAGDLAIARAAAGFLVRGVEARHLRAWRQAAEREAALFEQLVLPLIRQRNPQSRHQAAAKLHELARLGGELRSAILAASLKHHLDP